MMTTTMTTRRVAMATWMTILTDATEATGAAVVTTEVAAETPWLMIALSIRIMAIGRANRLRRTTATVDTLPTAVWSTAAKTTKGTWKALSMERTCIDIS